METETDLLTQIEALLAEIAAPPPSDFHHHCCTACREIWSHDRAQLTTKEEFDKGHTCPKCGTARITWKCQPDGSPLP
jgi:formate dehydrogenase maturation protein FdhE